MPTTADKQEARNLYGELLNRPTETGTDPLAEEMLESIRKRRQQTAPAAADTPGTDVDPLAAEMMESIRRRRAAPVTPPGAPGPAGPPVLPPTGVGPVPSTSPTGVAPPLSPPVGAAAPRTSAVAAPTGVPPATRQTAAAAPVERVGDATRYTLKPPKTLPVPKNVAPAKYPKGPAEMAFFQAQEETRRLPAFARAKGYTAAEAGPVREVQQRQEFALARWYHQERPKTIAALNTEYRKLETEAREIEREFQAGKKIAPARLANFESRRRGLEERNRELAGLEQRHIEQQQNAVPTMLQDAPHSGMWYPEEVARGAGQATPLFQKLGHYAFGLRADAVKNKLPAARAFMMREGVYEPTLPIPYKGQAGRAQGIKERQQLDLALRVLGAGVRDDGTFDAKAGQAPADPQLAAQRGTALDILKKMTPFQRKMLPVLKRQMRAEKEAEELAGLDQALGIDLFGLVAAEGVGAWMGQALRNPALRDRIKRAAPNLFVRYAAAIAPTMRAEFEPLSREALNKLLLRAAPRVVASGITGGAASSATAGVSTALSGGTPRQTAEAMGKAFLPGALLAGGTAGFLAAAQGTLRSGWNPKESPRLVSELVRQAQREGVPADRLLRLEQLLTQAGQAPMAAKGRAFRVLRDEFGDVLGRAAPGPARGASAARPKAGRGEYIAPDQPQPTPRAKTGPLARTSAGEEIPLRQAPRETLAQVAESGDPQAAAAAQAWLDRIEAHDLQMDAAVPAGEPQKVAGYAWLKSPEYKQNGALETAAATVANTNPALAAKLQQAASDLQRSYFYGYVLANHPEMAVTPTVAPPSVSVWRQLTPEEQQALPEEARRALLMQDLTNSLAVLAPDQPPVTTPAGFRERGWGFKSAADLAKRADEAFDAAQGMAAHEWVPPVVAEPEAAQQVSAGPAATGTEAAPALPDEGTQQVSTGPATGAQETAPQAAAPQDTTGLLAMGGGMASGITDNMYAMLWDKVQRGDTTEAGAPSTVLQAAKALRGRGGLQTLEEFKGFAQRLVDLKDQLQGEEFQKAARQLMAEYLPSTPQETAPQAAEAAAPAVSAPAQEAQKPAGKPIWEMGLDELDAAYEAARVEDRDLLVRLFGEEGAKRYQALQRRANSSMAPMAQVDAAINEVGQMEATLTEAERNQLYGIGTEGPTLDDIKEFRRALGQVDTESAKDLGDSLKWAITRVGEETDPAKMTSEQQIAYAVLREGMRIAQERGFDTAVVTEAAVKGAAGRFRDPADAAFMLRRFITEAPPEPEGVETAALPPAYSGPERRKDVSARKRIEDITDPEEMRQEALRFRKEARTDQRSGLQNVTAWEETPKKAHVAILDVDGLGYVNDMYGHAAGNALIQATGETLRKAGLGEDAFRTGGDEFSVHSDDLDDLQERLALARQIQENTVVSYKGADGQEHAFTGLSLSYGVGPDEGAADVNLYEDKAKRTAAGLRATGKGRLAPTEAFPQGAPNPAARPPGLVEVGRGGGAVQKGNGPQGAAPQRRADRGVEEGARAEVAPGYAGPERRQRGQAVTTERREGLTLYPTPDEGAHPAYRMSPLGENDVRAGVTVHSKKNGDLFRLVSPSMDFRRGAFVRVWTAEQVDDLGDLIGNETTLSEPDMLDNFEHALPRAEAKAKPEAAGVPAEWEYARGVDLKPGVVLKHVDHGAEVEIQAEPDAKDRRVPVQVLDGGTSGTWGRMVGRGEREFPADNFVDSDKWVVKPRDTDAVRKLVADDLREGVLVRDRESGEDYRIVALDETPRGTDVTLEPVGGGRSIEQRDIWVLDDYRYIKDQPEPKARTAKAVEAEEEAEPEPPSVEQPKPKAAPKPPAVEAKKAPAPKPKAAPAEKPRKFVPTADDEAERAAARAERGLPPEKPALSPGTRLTHEHSGEVLEVIEALQDGYVRVRIVEPGKAATTQAGQEIRRPLSALQAAYKVVPATAAKTKAEEIAEAAHAEYEKRVAEAGLAEPAAPAETAQEQAARLLEEDLGRAVVDAGKVTEFAKALLVAAKQKTGNTAAIIRAQRGVTVNAKKGELHEHTRGLLAAAKAAGLTSEDVRAAARSVGVAPPPTIGYGAQFRDTEGIAGEKGTVYTVRGAGGARGGNNLVTYEEPGKTGKPLLRSTSIDRDELAKMEQVAPPDPPPQLTDWHKAAIAEAQAGNVRPTERKDLKAGNVFHYPDTGVTVQLLERPPGFSWNAVILDPGKWKDRGAEVGTIGAVYDDQLLKSQTLANPPPIPGAKPPRKAPPPREEVLLPGSPITPTRLPVGRRLTAGKDMTWEVAEPVYEREGVKRVKLKLVAKGEKGTSYRDVGDIIDEPVKEVARTMQFDVPNREVQPPPEGFALSPAQKQAVADVEAGHLRQATEKDLKKGAVFQILGRFVVELTDKPVGGTWEARILKSDTEKLPPGMVGAVGGSNEALLGPNAKVLDRSVMPAAPAPKPARKKAPKEAGAKGGEVRLAEGQGTAGKLAVPPKWEDLRDVGPGTAILSHPGPRAKSVDDYMAQTAPAIRKAYDLLAKRGLNQMERLTVGKVGLTTVRAPDDGTVFGVNLRRTNGDQWIFVNPFVQSTYGATTYRERVVNIRDTPENLARSMAMVLLHEMAHVRVRMEGESLWSEMDRMLGDIGDDTFNEAQAIIRGALTGDTDAFTPEYREARDEYFRGLREPGGDVTFGDAARYARTGPPAGERPGAGIPGREGGARPDRGEGRRIAAQIQQRLGPVPAPDKYEGPVHEGLNKLAEENRGVATGPRPWERFTNEMRDWAHFLTRKRQTLPNTGEFAELDRRIDQATDVGKRTARDTAAFHLMDVLNGLDRRGITLFSDVMLLRDMLRGRLGLLQQEQAWIDAGNDPAEFKADLPVQITRAELEAELARVEAVAAQSPRVSEALKALVEMRRKVYQPFMRLYKDVYGIDLQFTPEDYMRRKVIQARMAQQRGQGIGFGQRFFARTKRPSFLKGRVAHGLAWDTDFVTAEMDYLPEMLHNTKILDLYTHVRDTLDKTPELARQALDINDGEFMPYLQVLASIARTGQPGRRVMTPENQKAVRKLTRYAAEGRLPDTQNGRFEPLLHEMAANGQANMEREAMGQPPLDLHVDAMARVPEYAEWLRTAGQAPGAVPTKQTPKTRATMKKHLGREFLDVKDLIPEGYREWIPDPSSIFRHVGTLQDHLIKAVRSGVADEIQVALEKIQMGGGLRRSLILPNAVADTLDTLLKPNPNAPSNPAERFFGGLQSKMKGAILTFPDSWIQYYLGNFFGDNDRAFRALGLPKSARVVQKYALRAGVNVRSMFKGNPPSADLREHMEQGLRSSTLTQAEEMGGGIDLVGRYSLRRHSPAVRMWNHLGNLRNGPHDMREMTTRHALYLYFRDHIRKHGKVPTYGASKRDVVDALPTAEAKAFRLSQDAVIDYEATTAAGRWIAKYVYPFYRYVEGSFRYEYRLLANAFGERRLAGHVGRTLLDFGIRSPVIAWQIGRYYLYGIAAIKAADLLNNALFPEEEKKLDERTRNRPHITFPNPITGEINTFTRFQSLGDVLAWGNLDNVNGYREAINNGRMTPGEAVRDALPEPIHKFVNGMAPQFHLIPALAGIQTFPRVTSPRKARDPWERFFEMASLDAAWRWGRGVPQRNQTWNRMFFASTRQDFAMNAYNEMRGYAKTWMDRRGKGGNFMGGDSSPKASALYWYLQGLRTGDEVAQRYYMSQYGREGGSDQGFHRSLRALDPLGGMNALERQEFVEKLSPADQARLRMAYGHWQMLAAPNAAVSGLEGMEANEWVAAFRDIVNSEIQEATPVADYAETNPEAAAQQEQREEDEMERRALQRQGF